MNLINDPDVVLVNERNEYLFIHRRTEDLDGGVRYVIVNRHGSIVRSDESDVNIAMFILTMFKAGYDTVDGRGVRARSSAKREIRGLTM